MRGGGPGDGGGLDVYSKPVTPSASSSRLKLLAKQTVNPVLQRGCGLEALHGLVVI